jgi:ribonuclease BN (tRNA processing enzyme)
MANPDVRANLPTLLTVLYLSMAAQAAHAANCTGHGIELQVLGSGGPEMQDKRASSSYLIWQDGKARVLVDSGGGSALRFGEAGATMSGLDVFLFTHLHADHSADFPALVKSAYFEDRSRPLPVFGPPGNARFPATTEFLRDLFDAHHGAWRYLSEYLQGGGDSFALQAHDVALGAKQIKAVYRESGIEAAAAPVIHGDVPALAWRVDIGGKRIVFSGDTNGDLGEGSGNLVRLAENADLFVAHNAIPEGTGGPVRLLHMPPSVIGNIAAAAKVKALVLSHRMLRTLGREDDTRAVIAARYQGPFSFANDLDCYPLPTF